MQGMQPGITGAQLAYSVKKYYQLQLIYPKLYKYF